MDVRTRFWNVIRNVNVMVSIFHFLGTIISWKGQYKHELSLSPDRDLWASTTFLEYLPSCCQHCRSHFPRQVYPPTQTQLGSGTGPGPPNTCECVPLCSLDAAQKRGAWTRATWRPPKRRASTCNLPCRLVLSSTGPTPQALHPAAHSGPFRPDPAFPLPSHSWQREMRATPGPVSPLPWGPGAKSESEP